jgi:hypothetical protein
METETILILLCSVAATGAIAVHQLHVPYTVVLVVSGLALGILSLFTLWHRLVGRPASEYGRLCHGTGATGEVAAGGGR